MARFIAVRCNELVILVALKTRTRSATTHSLLPSFKATLGRQDGNKTAIRLLSVCNWMGPSSQLDAIYFDNLAVNCDKSPKITNPHTQKIKLNTNSFRKVLNEGAIVAFSHART